MLKAFDTAQPLTPAVIARAKEQGYRSAGRYYGSPGSSKLLTAPEARLLTDAGLPIFSYFERTAGRALLGRRAGEADGALAASQAVAIGQPAGTGICFAIDTDVDMDNAGQRAAILDYFTGLGVGADHHFRIGVYGDGEACLALVKEGLVDYEILAGAMGWQGSRAYRDARLWEGMQYPEVSASRSPIGIAIDPVDLVGLAAVGAWTLAGPAADDAMPSPAPYAVTPTEAIATATRLQEQLKALGLYIGAIDGQVGMQTSGAAMRAWRLAQ